MKICRFIVCCFLALFVFSSAKAQKLSNDADISLLISSPDPNVLVSSYGHTLLRIKDPKLKFDYVFNYGTFDRNLSGFQTAVGIILSKLKYEIWVTPFKEYLQETKNENRKLVEYSFNFSAEEKEAIWENLISILKDKDRKYVFDFFTENCTTFVRDLITFNIGNKIILPDFLGKSTYRDLNLKYTRDNLWYVFIMDLVSGEKMDRKPSPYESLYVPEELGNAWMKSYILENNGQSKNLISTTKVLINGKFHKKNHTLFMFSPLFFSVIFFVMTLFLTIVKNKDKVFNKWFDIFLFGFTGFFGLLFFLFKFSCGRWYVLMDWKLLWLHPFHLLAVFFILKSFNKAIYIYHCLNIILLLFLIFGKIYLPQNIDAAFYILMLILVVRSIIYIRENHYCPKKLNRI
jgi:Ca2+/Na+ antiporter